jgi:hypothetical protein
MNAQQSKQLFSAAINVRDMLAPRLVTLLGQQTLTDDQQKQLDNIRGLFRAIAEIENPPIKAPARKSKKIPIAQYGEHRRDIPCPKCRGTCQLPKWLVMTDRDGSTRESTGYDAEAIAKKLEYCACGHAGTIHNRDKMDNWLNCRDCDCDHFHYAVDGEAKQAA